MKSKNLLFTFHLPYKDRPDLIFFMPRRGMKKKFRIFSAMLRSAAGAVRGLSGGRPPPPAPLSTVVTSAAAAGLGMSALYSLHYALGASAASTVVGSIGSSAVLLYCAPAAPFSQPRNVIGGHFLACATGLTLRHIPFVADNPILLGSFSIAGAVAAMQLTNTVHPPAGATALMATSSPMDAFFIVPVFTGSVSAVAVALFINNMRSGVKYPLFW